ncbi:simple sugar transport system substrate-binding protein [Fontibacillus panacisegetis]|uniref:Simple sugar transport system substrate-binding protein n=1 Tax=Fontibacillus panacisegetis TaxID=670482 RepID=A0A1G7UBP6_9BACL|nr:simple sugar transport system substrate-binding protein [Fontibacillus panacisegetis]
MKNITFFRKPVFTLIMLVLVLAISAYGIKKEAAPSNNETTEPAAAALANSDINGAEGKELAGKRIALIMEINTGAFSQQYV